MFYLFFLTTAAITAITATTITATTITAFIFVSSCSFQFSMSNAICSVGIGLFDMLQSYSVIIYLILELRLRNINFALFRDMFPVRDSNDKESILAIMACGAMS